MRIAILALLMFSAETSASGAAAQHIFVPERRWTVDFGDVRCSLARRIGGAGSPILILSCFLGRDEPQFLLMRDGPSPLRDLPRRFRVVLSPGERIEEVRSVRTAAPGVDVITVTGLAEGFFDRFASAETIRMESDRRTFLTMAAPGAQRAVAMLRSCNDDLLKSWGIDTAARDSWQRLPKVVGGYINSGDYPREAMSAHQTGTVVARMRVGLDGRASECIVVVSAHSELLDRTTCRLIATRFRFEPALDRQGNAIATTYIQTVEWRLPG